MQVIESVDTMEKRSGIKTLAAAICLLFCVTGLSGCKYSAKLHELIQNRYEHLLTIDSAKEFVNTLDSDTLTEELVSILETEEAERQTEEDPETPQAGEESQTDKQARQQKSGQTAQRRARLTGTSSKSNQSGEEATSTDSPSLNPSDEAESGGSGTGTDGSGENGYNIVPGANSGPKRQIVDARGVYVEIPENVSSTAAAGDTAALIAMVGGEGTLRASSESFAWNAYQNSEIGGAIAPLWQGDGSYMMTDDNFSALISLAPEVVVESSGSSSFTDEQLNQLDKAGIAYVVLPSMDSVDGMKQAVSLAGQLIGDHTSEGGLNSNDLAAQYLDYADSLLTTVESKVSSAGTSAGFSNINGSDDGRYNGKYSLFIKGWDPDARWAITFKGTEFKSGMGTAYTGNALERNSVFMSQIMSVAGLENTMEVKNDELASYIEYLSPVRTTREKLAATGGYATRMNNNRLFEIGDYCLGDEEFPAVIVTSSEAAAAMRNDELWQVYDVVYTGDGNLTVRGFQLSDGSIVGSSIRSSYDIHVMPRGLGTWYNSPEGVLSACWMARQFYDAYSEEELMNEVKYFYSTFYRIGLTYDQARTMINGQ